MPFKKVQIEKSLPENFRDLFYRLKRHPSIQHLWDYQTDIFKVFHSKHLNSKDVAFESPTGTGKTLTGLIIGEFQRLTKKYRVLFLCPTRQLGHQVHELSKLYGIKTHPFVGPKKYFPPVKLSQYRAGNLIAITTYNGLFNVNPEFKNANLLIFDDAHAAENYIPSHWSLELDRKAHFKLYNRILNLFKEDLPIYFSLSQNSLFADRIYLLSDFKSFERMRFCVGS